MNGQNDVGSEYLIINTDLGLVPITDGKQIAVYRLLEEKKSMNYNGIASSINVPSSTLKYVLSKLMESHAIFKEPGDRGKYRIIGMTVLSETNECPYKDIIKIKMRNEVVNYKSPLMFSSYISLYAEDIGINLDKIWQTYAVNICSNTYKMIPKGSVDDVIQPIMNLFKKLCVGFNIALFRSKPLILVFYGPCDNVPFIKACIMLFQMWLEYATDISYSREFDYTRCDGSHITVKFTSENRIFQPYRPVKLYSGIRQEFIMVSVDNTTRIITNPIQITILRLLKELPKTVTELVEESACSRSTITMNIRKLVKMRYLELLHNTKGIVHYCTKCDILMDGNGIECDCGGIQSSINNSLDVSGFTGGFGQYFIQSMRCLGVNCDKLMFNMGSRLMILYGITDWDFNNVFAILRRYAQCLNIDISVEDTQPLTFGLEFHTDYMKNPCIHFIMGCIDLSLSKLTNNQFGYCIDCTTADKTYVSVIDNPKNIIDYGNIIRHKFEKEKITIDKDFKQRIKNPILSNQAKEFFSVRSK